MSDTLTDKTTENSEPDKEVHSLNREVWVIQKNNVFQTGSLEYQMMILNKDYSCHCL